MIIDLQATKSSRAYVNEGHAVCFKYLSLQDVCSGVYKKKILVRLLNKNIKKPSVKQTPQVFETRQTIMWGSSLFANQKL